MPSARENLEDNIARGEWNVVSGGKDDQVRGRTTRFREWQENVNMTKQGKLLLSAYALKVPNMFSFVSHSQYCLNRRRFKQ